MDDQLRALLAKLDQDEINRLSRCFCLAEQILGSPEELPVAFAELVARFYSADRFVEANQNRLLQMG